MSYSRLKALALIPVLLTGCSSAPYLKNQSEGNQILDAAGRYGSVAAAATGGYFAAKGLNASTPAAAAIAAGSGVVMYGFNVFNDKGKQNAYDQGVTAGAQATRAGILKKAWEREAIYGLPPEGSAKKIPFTRNVYVPTRTVDGVIMQGGYQQVQYYP